MVKHFFPRRKISIPGMTVKMSMEKAAGMAAENEALRADLGAVVVAAQAMVMESAGPRSKRLAEALSRPNVKALLEEKDDG